MNLRRILLLGIIMMGLAVSVTLGQDTKNQTSDIAGEIFGTPVSLGNYYFAKRALMVFGTKWGPEPTNAQETEDLVWENLLLSFEAFKRGIEVSQEELDDEITRTLKSEKVDFAWKENKEAFDAWLKEKINENSELFSNQMRYLIQIQKLRQQVLDSINPSVSEEEAFKAFLNEYNTLDTELAQFDNSKDAGDFYKKAKSNPKFWDRQVKDNPKLFRRPGFVG